MSKKFANNNLLLKLCNNYLDHIYPTNPQYEDIADQIVEFMKQVKTQFADNHEIWDTFDKMEHLFSCAEAEVSTLYFCEGFKAGMLLALEILDYTPPEN